MADTTEGNDVVDGGNGADFMDGGAGSDSIDGGNGSDTLVGGDGNDTLRGGRGSDYLDGSAGVDLISFSDAVGAISFSLQQGTNLLDINGYWSAGALTGIGVDGYKNMEGVIGSLYDDTINGSAVADILIGNDGNDRLSGAGGNDLLEGGEGYDSVFGGGGRDVLDGGAGNDELSGGSGGDTLTGGLGSDLLDGGENSPDQLADSDYVDYSINDDIEGATGVNVDLTTGLAVDGLGGIDTLINIERVIGTNFDDVLTGGDQTNSDINRSEQFEGRGGNDVITGAIDNNFAVYISAPSGIVVNLSSSDIDLDPGDGVDLIASRTARDGYGTIDTLINIDRIVGSAFQDVIYGSDLTVGNERFEGMAGDDYVNGLGGIDYVMYPNSPTAVVVGLGSSGSGSASDGFGTTDTFDNIEAVRGSQFSDVLNGSGRADVAERYEGMGGDDSINGAGGPDRVEYFQSPTAVVVNLGSTQITVNDVPVNAGTALDGFGGLDTLSSIEQVAGSRFDDAIFGGSGGNRLDGHVGNDTVDGGGGNDVLIGGQGSDVLFSGSGADTFRWDAGNQGTGEYTDTIIGFDSLAGSDKLDIGDLLSGETEETLDAYLSFLFDGYSTTVEVSTAGGIVDQRIMLQNVDLTSGNTLSDSQIIDDLLSAGKLITDI
jgi:Ca2+-binding RTX toxin-like protein